MRTSVFVVGHKNDRLKKRPLCRGKTTLHVSQLLTKPGVSKTTASQANSGPYRQTATRIAGE